MTTWTPEDLSALGGASEITIATERPDTTTRRPVPIWVVRVGDDLFIRSYNGPAGSWYRQILANPYAHITEHGAHVRVRLEHVGTAATGVDEAYWAKYGRGSYGAAMTTPEAAATTLRLHPAP
ncbi:DUF2255 family protein [Cellulomonas uda]|uniref:DUF2255 domain-containing protein n=1 Tax=Cellulomonas uda TaxID=1714 RepID=A0A4Y3K6P4_CELUD|nr:DUF2255 family protein [Cellulomonas uda]NII66637.1 hypothetical protein [Cellulomonas uda]GEA79683.1 hypothetical protein CUD01_01270 [Cellulomonas uda]